ncbi:hypothetical protein GUITHDRAFT_107931 [Guillardia theta CCMP2712]|uniref:Uncharacterized protein n=1 Tax=Guillardia theta (strain CCMP2712) TaxID=905079 RepID=L1JCR8_GUITC|nr:hypothetical protein GUITHDRAFT_107931 [Guillardia theta CCMP2712]EKX46323.1 hypothetical protein GUITHDRAFT_107931 [Guillardia theta CCMP2712]|eukprot:XP_005833303.1 hypothetical protein GUITHDRAFT_107931 [Guillardia theta CCMP2712]
MCINTFAIDRAVFIQTAAAHASTPLDLCSPSLSDSQTPDETPSPDVSASPGAEDASEQPISSDATKGLEAGNLEEKYGKLSWTKRRQLRALEHSIGYIERLQREAGGSVDGRRLPCLNRLRKF